MNLLIRHNPIHPFIFAFTIAITSCFGSMRAAESRPNVLLVITDDQGYGDIGFHGNRVIKTPTLDSLAKQSLRLTNFHVDPTCAETRAALMTGRYPLRGGVWHTIMGRSILRRDAKTMPQYFAASGYRTGMFGKWHLGDNYPYRPQDRGFQQTLHLGGGGITQVPDVWGNDYFDDVYWSGDKLKPERGYCTDVFFSAAADFIKAQSDQPFFCYVAANAPHGPYLVPEQYKKPYVDQGVPEPMASFYGMIANIDENLGRLLKLLDEQGKADNTIVVFMTDNGTAAGFAAGKQGIARGFNAGMKGMKGTKYEGGHRVPCFVRYPGKLPSDREFGQLCAHMDLLPTLAGLCGVDTKSDQPFDGVNLTPFVKEELPWRERTLVVQSHRVEEPEPWKKSAVMTDRWRLLEGTELYDMTVDPGQEKNVAASNSATVTRLRAFYESWWKEMAVDPNRYVEILLGAPQAKRVRLTAHDWHSPAPVVWQPDVRKDPVSDGFWAVDLQQPGAYQFLLMRRPMAEPTAVDAVSAEVEVAGVKVQVPIEPTAVCAPINVRLESGSSKLFTRFIKSDGTKVGAYFVQVNYLGDVPASELASANDRLPNWLKAGDRVAWLGGTLIERLNESGSLDAEVSLRAPLAGLSFVNLGWSGDDLSGRARGVFGGAEEGRKRRVRDLQLSGASVVVIAYGMGELLDPAMDAGKLQTYETELNALLAEIKSMGKRAVIAAAPEWIDDKSTDSQSANVRAYAERRQLLNSMLQKVAGEAKLPLIELGAVKSSMFESGTYLSVNGYAQWSIASGELLFRDAKHPAVASREHEQELRATAKEAARLFFDMHRPQNETYLLLFRKHEQGNNAVEMDQFRPLLAEVQFELIEQAAQR
ncbi:MAG: sulfatase-like hydrolase/transferase [Pirellulales bacterium]